jgi:hypothetical protein
MTALSAERVTTTQKGSDPIPNYLSLGVAATKKPFQGGMVSILKNGASTGYAAPTTGTGDQIVVGRCEGSVDNSAGIDGAAVVKVRQGVFKYANGGDITALKIGEPCYASDDQTVFLDDNAGQRPFAGIVFDVDSSGVFVEQGLHLQPGGAAGITVDAVQSALKSALKARGVCDTNMSIAAFIGVAGGTPQDGITYAKDDIVLLTAQTVASQNGPWKVGVVAAGVAPLTRPDWWTPASLIVQGVVIEVGGEGTKWKGSSWKALCSTALKVVDTDDPVLYPRFDKGVTTAMAAQTKTISAFIFSTASDLKVIADTPAGTQGILSTPLASITAGVKGVGQFVVNSTGAETSTLRYCVTNW